MGTYLVMVNNLRRNLNHKVLFAITFLLPVVLCLLIGVVHFGKSAVRVGILMDTSDQSASNNLKDVYHLLDQSKGIRYAVANESSLNTDLITGRYQVVLDYRGSRDRNDFHLITYQKKAKSELLEEAFQEAFRNQRPLLLNSMKPGGLTSSERNIAILMSLFMVFSTIYSSEIIRDRQSGVIQRYQYATRSSHSYIQGYILHTFLIIFCQNLLCMAVLSIVQKSFTLGFMECLIMAAIIAILSTVFGVLLSVGSKSEVQANIMASALTAILSLLGGTFVAVQSMPGLLRILSYASPIRWVVGILNILPWN